MKSCMLALLALGSAVLADSAIREGDVVFSGSARGQGEAIIAATGSQYTHCGIVFQSDGKWMVLEAVQPVGVVSLEEFKSRSKPGLFLARRLKTPLAPADYQKARAWAEAQIGKNYDGRFLWDDANLYCSELVWKIYARAGVELCAPRKFRDYDLQKPSVRKLIDQRFGGMERVPLDEKVVAPSDLAGSRLLVDVAR
jgi:Permuted papain-like amidase enzyme, YaeF/YiiX, C92 family